MRNWKLRSAALLSVLLMMVGIVSGCGKKPSESGSGDKDIVADLGGKEIIFTSMDKGWFLPTEESENYEAVQELVEEIEQKFNCKLTFNYIGPWDVYFQKIVDLTMSGERVGDIAAFDRYIYPSSMLNGIFLPLQDYVDVKNYDVWEENCEPFFDINGKIYAVSQKSKTLLPEYLCFYNKTLFEEKGLAAKYNLQELVKNRQWTWDKFRTIVRESNLDTNGDGKTDIWGLGGQGLQFSRITSAFVVANNAFFSKKENNSVKITMNSPEYLQAMEFVYDLTWKDKVICADEDWRSYDTFAMFGMGQSMFFICTNWWIQTLQTMVDDTVFGVLPVPIGPNAKDYAVRDTGNVHTYGMLANCTDPEGTGKVFQYFFENYPKSETTIREAWSSRVFDTESLDMIELLSALPHTFDWSVPNTPTVQEVWLGEHGLADNIPPATFVASVIDAMQTEADDLWQLASFG